MFVALVFVSHISHPATKISFDINQEGSFNALASLRWRFFTLRVEDKVNRGYKLRMHECFIEFRFFRGIKHRVSPIFPGFVSLVCDFLPQIIHFTNKTRL